jgi:hypothetical protein
VYRNLKESELGPCCGDRCNNVNFIQLEIHVVAPARRILTPCEGSEMLSQILKMGVLLLYCTAAAIRLRFCFLEAAVRGQPLYARTAEGWVRDDRMLEAGAEAEADAQLDKSAVG